MSPRADNHEPEIGRERLEQAAEILRSLPEEDPWGSRAEVLVDMITGMLARGAEASEAHRAPRKRAAEPEEAEHYYRTVTAAGEPILLYVEQGEWSHWAAISIWGRWNFEAGDVPAEFLEGAEAISAEEAAVQLVTGPAEVVQFLDRKAWLEEGRPAAKTSEFPTMSLAEWRREELQPILNAGWPVRVEPYGTELAVVVAGPAPRRNADPGGVFCWLMPMAGWNSLKLEGATHAT